MTWYVLLIVAVAIERVAELVVSNATGRGAGNAVESKSVPDTTR
jgi:hypothetical protein